MTPNEGNHDEVTLSPKNQALLEALEADMESPSSSGAVTQKRSGLRTVLLGGALLAATGGLVACGPPENNNTDTSGNNFDSSGVVYKDGGVEPDKGTTPDQEVQSDSQPKPDQEVVTKAPEIKSADMDFGVGLCQADPPKLPPGNTIVDPNFQGKLNVVADNASGTATWEITDLKNSDTTLSPGTLTAPPGVMQVIAGSGGTGKVIYSGKMADLGQVVYTPGGSGKISLKITVTNPKGTSSPKDVKWDCG